MTREEKIELLQDQIEHGRISSAELGAECEKNDIDLHEDVLEPIGFNTCDRCGECGDSEQDFLWVDSYDWWREDEDDKAILKAIKDEGIDYCALCWDCINELREKGKENMSQLQEITAIMKEWGTHRRELFEQYCKEKDKDASIIFNEEEWNKFVEWEKKNEVIAREVRIYKCNKIDYGFNADDELELDRQIVNWEGEPNEKFDEYINDEVEKRFGITYEDDGYYEKYEEVQDEITHKYLDKRAEGLVEFINDFGGDYTASLREYTASDCDSLGMTVEELREYAENERVFRGGLNKQRRWR